jgi:hypothetical protein
MRWIVVALAAACAASTPKPHRAPLENRAKLDPTACPTDDELVRRLRTAWMLDETTPIEIGICRAARVPGPAFVVFAILGHERLRRTIVVDDAVVHEQEQILPNVPQWGGWRGELRIIDLDGDGVDEIVELEDEPLPDSDTTFLRIHRVHDGAMQKIFDHVMTSRDATSSCTATMQITKDGMVIDAKAGGEDPEDCWTDGLHVVRVVGGTIALDP